MHISTEELLQDLWQFLKYTLWQTKTQLTNVIPSQIHQAADTSHPLPGVTGFSSLKPVLTDKQKQGQAVKASLLPALPTPISHRLPFLPEEKKIFPALTLNQHYCEK